MSPQVCKCCGEPMIAGGNELSRNPNMCASCSSLADGMGEDEDGALKTEPEPLASPPAATK